MILEHLKICNFKNIAEADLEFSPKINAFVGNNGMGKSNLLDAIYFMSFTRSFSGMTDQMLIRRDESFAMINAGYLRHGVRDELSMGMTRGRRKTLKRQGKEYQRISEHIGAFPVVISAPQDVDLIRGTSEERRRLMDMVISQSDPVYLDHLIRYSRALEQRNSLLRARIADRNLYEAVEMVMDAAAEAIHSRRATWVAALTEIFNATYHDIAGVNAENVSLEYISTLNDEPSLIRQLEAERQHDEAVRHTTVGPHRDDIGMFVDSMPLKRAGSQGQIKTFAIALRLAQYEFLRLASPAGLRPLLLLDDIFDKLDASRVERIVETVTANPAYGQIFITDTNRSHLDEILRRTPGDNRLWSVADGKFSPL
ncbi:MAG: DNA replication and repair protein RecF [Muribaculum sp.]|nr:DNA replication and repair protein RecF [Muribaculum sp.]